MPEQSPLNKGILKGAAFSIVARWGVRFIGLINTVILARLLTPEDFGVAAMATLVIGLLETLSEFGVVNLVIRSQDRSSAFVNTGWTLQVLQGIGIAVMLVLLAPLAVAYFEEPRLRAVLYVGALTVLFGSTKSIGVALARKDLNYAADLRFLVASRVLVFAATVLIAFWERSYWAIVLGGLIGTASATALSYWMFNWRPKIDLTHSRIFLRFASAAIPSSLARFLTERTGALVVGGTADAAKLGLFNTSIELSNMATSEVVGPIERVLIPNYAKLSDRPERLAHAFLYSVRLLVTIALPLSIGLSLVAQDFVLVLLGSQWKEAGELVQWLAIYAFATGMAQALTANLLVALGREQLASVLYWARLMILAPIMTFAGLYIGVLAMTVAATATSILLLPIALLVATNNLQLNAWKVVASLWRQIAAVVTMSIAILSLPETLPGGAFGLLSKVVGGGMVYTTCLVGLWALAGRPDGVERDLVSALLRMRRVRK